MSVDTSKWQVSDYEANAPAVGLSPANFVPAQFQSICQSVAQNSVPQKAPSTFVTACTASLIIRGILYFKSNPGDCGSPTQLNLSDVQLTGLAGSAASAATKTIGAVAGISSLAGAVLPGIGVAVQAISQIFAQHAQAVANEQATICKVAGVVNQVIPFYDSAVRRGLISPNTAYMGMQNYLQQVIEALDGIQKPCDAACVYIAILQAHYNFVERYYPLIAPASIAPAAPGAPPTTQVGPGYASVSGSGTLSGTPAAVAGGTQQEESEPVIYPLYGEQAGGTVYVLYNGVLYPVNILSNSIITPGYQFRAGILPPGYSWNSVDWVATRAQLPYPQSNVPPTAGIFGGMSTTDLLLIAAVGFVAFMLVSGKRL